MIVTMNPSLADVHSLEDRRKDASLGRDGGPEFRGIARRLSSSPATSGAVHHVYELSNPMVTRQPSRQLAHHIVISKRSIGLTGGETYIFPCNSEGIIMEPMIEMPGSVKEDMAPDEVLRILGYSAERDDQ